MGNKLDILRDYEKAVQKASELNDVCAKISTTTRMRHLFADYDQRRRAAEVEREQLGFILEAMDAAED